MKKLAVLIIPAMVAVLVFAGCHTNSHDTTSVEAHSETAIPQIETTSELVSAESETPAVSTDEAEPTQQITGAPTTEAVESSQPSEIETIPPTTEADVSETSNSTEQYTASTEPSPFSKKDVWLTSGIKVDGVTYSTMMPYSTLQENGWDFDFEDYNIGENYVLNPGDWSAATIHLNNTEVYGKALSSAEIVVGFINNTEDILPIKECSIRAIRVDGTYNTKLIDADGETPCYDFEFAGGIKRGATEEQVLQAYGDPFDVSENSREKSKTFTYESDDGLITVKLKLYDAYGLQSIEITNRRH